MEGLGGLKRIEEATTVKVKDMLKTGEYFLGKFPNDIKGTPQMGLFDTI